MAVFIGTYENKVDRKGRVSVPAAFRQSLNNLSFHGIVVFPSRSGQAIEACGIDLMEKTIAENQSANLLSDSGDPASIFYDLQQAAFDADGRVILPASLRDHAGITDQATFVGIGNTFQIWSPEALAAFKSSIGGRS